LRENPEVPRAIRQLQEGSQLTAGASRGWAIALFTQSQETACKTQRTISYTPKIPRSGAVLGSCSS